MGKFGIALLATIAVGLSVQQAQATNSIVFGADQRHCGGAVMCSADGTRGYLHDGHGQAFKASTISKWFQIDVDGKNHIKGQLAEPEGSSGSFLVVNDTGRPITLFALPLASDFSSRTASTHACYGAKGGKLCTGFSAEGGTGAYKYNGQLSGRGLNNCTKGTPKRQFCSGSPTSADYFASNRVTFSWRALAGGVIPTGAKFTINFSGWNNDAWPAPPQTWSLVMLSTGPNGPGDHDSLDSGFKIITPDDANTVFWTSADNLPCSTSAPAQQCVYNLPTGAFMPAQGSPSLPAYPEDSISDDASLITSASDYQACGDGSSPPGYPSLYSFNAQTDQCFFDVLSNSSIPISGNGQYLIFYGCDTAIIGECNSNSSYNAIYAYNIANGTTTEMLAPDGSEPNAQYGCDPYDVSDTGEFILFGCDATNLVEGINYDAVYIWDQFHNTFQIVTRSTHGQEGVPSNFPGGMSRNGEYVTYKSSATDLVAGGTTGWQIFAYDTNTMVTQLASSASDGTEANASSLFAQNAALISDDGRYVTFTSQATNLGGGGNNTGATYQVYVKDLLTGDISQVSLGSDGNVGNGDSSSPSISGDGLYVVFYSNASNLVSGGNNGVQQVYLATLE
jgi:hypothetical protein